MTYGSATTASEVVPFLRSVYRTDDPPADIVQEFQRRFDLIGRSPLIEITLAQAAAVEQQLNLRPSNNRRFVVRVGMLHSAPTIATAVTELARAGVTEIYGLLLSPQYSPIIMAGYARSHHAAAAKVGLDPDKAVMIAPWPVQPDFISFLSTQIAQQRPKLSQHYACPIPIIFTTHSLPEAVVKLDPNYIAQLQATIDAVVTTVGLTPSEWTSCYQSAGHSPEPWLKPDLTEVLAQLPAKTSAVLIVPLQFCADHLEILYDLDIAAADQATAAGINYHRIDLPNTNPLFIKALVSVVAEAAS